MQFTKPNQGYIGQIKILTRNYQELIFHVPPMKGFDYYFTNVAQPSFLFENKTTGLGNEWLMDRTHFDFLVTPNKNYKNPQTPFCISADTMKPERFHGFFFN